MELDQLLRPQGPGLRLLVATESEASDLRAALSEGTKNTVVFRWIRGQKARTKPALFDEFAATLQFPLYFGENWDAFDECLTDLAWLPGDAYVLVVGQSIHLLDKEPPGEFERLLKILEKAGEEWSSPRGRPHPPRPFHVWLQCTKKEEPALQAKLNAAKASFDFLHL
jgi:hypothetical protein